MLSTVQQIQKVGCLLFQSTLTSKIQLLVEYAHANCRRVCYVCIVQAQEAHGSKSSVFISPHSFLLNDPGIEAILHAGVSATFAYLQLEKYLNLDQHKGLVGDYYASCETEKESGWFKYTRNSERIRILTEFDYLVMWRQTGIRISSSLLLPQ